MLKNWRGGCGCVRGSPTVIIIRSLSQYIPCPLTHHPPPLLPHPRVPHLLPLPLTHLHAAVPPTDLPTSSQNNTRGTPSVNNFQPPATSPQLQRLQSVTAPIDCSRGDLASSPPSYQVCAIPRRSILHFIRGNTTGAGGYSSAHREGGAGRVGFSSIPQERPIKAVADCQWKVCLLLKRCLTSLFWLSCRVFLLSVRISCHPSFVVAGIIRGLQPFFSSFDLW